MSVCICVCVVSCLTFDVRSVRGLIVVDEIGYGMRRI